LQWGPGAGHRVDVCRCLRLCGWCGLHPGMKFV
jgi:hypothetical protein